jgi:hypothetical protein
MGKIIQLLWPILALYLCNKNHQKAFFFNLKLAFRLKSGPRDTYKGATWPADENSGLPLLYVLLCMQKDQPNQFSQKKTTDKKMLVKSYLKEVF